MYIGLLKKTLVFLLFILCCRVFASGGALAESSSPLHVIRTQYFDIIFPEECRQTAHKIEDVCDDYYLEITSLLETEPYQRFPVTITRSVEVLNAYYAAIPYNRIVLYDTLPETSLDMYEDTIQSVFYHELTHAVTYNIKSKWSKRLSFISDALNPAWFTVTTFWAEGATVSFESKKQGGRLNDPFSTQIVNQSVIEDKFPNWRDVTGARDTYPGGTDAYMFGSMFASYLQDTYGMSKYAEFWKNAGSRLSFSFIAGVFEKTYGMSVGDAWDDFEKTLQIEHSTKTANLFSNKNSRISSFDVFFDDTETKIAYFDSASSSLRLVTLDSDGKLKKNKKLLAVTGINRVVFSSDGTKLALSRYIDKKNYKCVAAEYDLKKKKYNEQKITNRRDAFFIQTDNKNELSFVEMSQYRDGEIVFSPVEIEKNLYASIVKDSLKWKIRLSDSEKTLIDYDFSEISGGDIARNLILHELHSIKGDSDSIWLSFTWAELGKGGKMLSRIGFLKVDRSSMNVTAFLQKENSFAGFTDAVPSKNVLKNLENSDEFGSVFDVYAVASEYEKSPLYKVEMKTGDFEKIFLTVNENESSILTAKFKEKQNYNIFKKSNEITYNPLRYYSRGVYLPFLGTVPVYSHDFEQNSTEILGFTFLSTNPWGDRQINFSAGYDPVYQNGGMNLGFSGVDDSFQYALNGTCIFDKDGFMQSADSISFTKYLWRGKVSYFAFGTEGKFLYGRQIIDELFEDNVDDSTGKSADGIAFLQFSNVHKISPEVYNSLGFVFQPFLLSSYRDSENLIDDDKYLNTGCSLTLRFPVIIPFIVKGSFFPSSKYCAAGSVTAILADFEIHKGIPAVSLFMQRVVVSATYSGKVFYQHGEFWDVRHTDTIFKNIEKSDYSDVIQAGADLYLSPNTGFLANDSIQFSVGYTFIFRPHPKEDESKFVYGIAVGANY